MLKRLYAAVMIAGLLTACAEPGTAPTEADANHTLLGESEGEILINLWINDTLVTNTNYRVELEPDVATGARLTSPYSLTQYLKTSGWHFEWIDPGASDGVPCRYPRGDELHGGSGDEVHCVRPGSYLVKVFYGFSDDPIRVIPVEYQQALENQYGGTAFISDYGDSQNIVSANGSYVAYSDDDVIHDLRINIELADTLNTAETVVFRADNGGASGISSTFSSADTVSGGYGDSFRFTVRGTETGWKQDREEEFLVRYFWDYNGASQVITSYGNPFSESTWLMNSFKPTIASSTGIVTVGVHVMRPDERPSNVPTHYKYVRLPVPHSITISPSSPTIPYGGVYNPTYTATVRDANNNVVNNVPVSWEATPGTAGFTIGAITGPNTVEVYANNSGTGTIRASVPGTSVSTGWITVNVTCYLGPQQLCP